MRLEIDGIEMELTSQLIAITRAVLNEDNITERKIDITNSFNVPDTNVNRLALGSGQLLGSSSDGFDKTYTGKLIDQEVIFNGIAFVKEYTKRNFKIQLAEKSKSFFNQLSEDLTELAWDDYDILFNQDGYDATKLIGTSSPWFWPKVSMHEDNTVDKSPFTTGDDRFLYSRPMLRYKFILDLIFETEGWTYNYSDDDLLQRLALSANHSNFYVTSYQKVLNGLYAVGDSITNLDDNDFEKDIVTYENEINLYGNPATAFRFRGTVTATVECQLQITASDGINDDVTEVFNIEVGENDIDFTSNDYSLSDDDATEYSLSFDIIGDDAGFVNFDNVYMYTLISESSFYDLSTNPLLDYKVKVYDHLPDFTQVKMLRQFLLMTNSILVPDSLQKNIEIKSLNRLRKNKSVNWSKKFDEGSETITCRTTDFGKKNWLLYSNDDTVYEELGSSYFEVNNDSLEDEEDFIELDFSASKETNLDGFTTADFSIYGDTTTTETDSETGEEIETTTSGREQDIDLRLIYVYNDNEEEASYTIGKFTGINWGSLKSTYYQDWFDSFYRYRWVEAYFDLTRADVIGHDFLDLVYLDQFKSSFFVVEISDYIPGQLTKVKMIKFL